MRILALFLMCVLPQTVWAQSTVPNRLLQSERSLDGLALSPDIQWGAVEVNHGGRTQVAVFELTRLDKGLQNLKFPQLSELEDRTAAHPGWVGHVLVFQGALPSTNRRLLLVTPPGLLPSELLPRDVISGDLSMPTLMEGSVAFIRLSPEGQDVYRFDAQTGVTARLTYDGHPKRDLAFSTDGTRLAYTGEVPSRAGTDIWEIRLNTPSSKPAPTPAESGKKKKKKKNKAVETPPPAPQKPPENIWRVTDKPGDQHRPMYVGDSLLAVSVDEGSGVSRLVRLSSIGDEQVWADNVHPDNHRVMNVSADQQWVCWVSIDQELMVTSGDGAQTFKIETGLPFVRSPVFDPRAKTPTVVFISRAANAAGDGIYRLEISSQLQ